MKKLLILFASPHKNGATRALLDTFLGESFCDWAVTQYDVCAEPVQPCTACGLCKKQPKCSMRDFDGIDAALRESDLLIIASPVYNLSFPAQMKSVIDRFQIYFEARFSRGERPAIQKPRQAVLLLTLGRENAFAVEVCEKTLRQSFSVMNTALLETLVLTDTDQGISKLNPVFAKARTLGLEIAAEL